MIDSNEAAQHITACKRLRSSLRCGARPRLKRRLGTPPVAASPTRGTLCERQSAKLIVKGIFNENIFLNPAPQERATSMWRARNE